MRDETLLAPERGTDTAAARPACALGGVPALPNPSQADQYRAMEDAFRAGGGIVSADDIVWRLGRRTDQPISQLARWIVDRDVLSFHWQGRTVLPLFQFELHALRPRAEVVAVIHELAPVLGDWDTAVWFAEPNAWLGEEAPVVAIGRDAAAVFHAARAERYLARA